MVAPEGHFVFLLFLKFMVFFFSVRKKKVLTSFENCDHKICKQEQYEIRKIRRLLNVNSKLKNRERHENYYRKVHVFGYGNVQKNRKKESDENRGDGNCHVAV